MTVCSLDSMALTFPEKQELQIWLKSHQKTCHEIKNACDYSLTFLVPFGGKEVVAKAKCRSCGENHRLTK